MYQEIQSQIPGATYHAAARPYTLIKIPPGQNKPASRLLLPGRRIFRLQKKPPIQLI